MVLKRCAFRGCLNDSSFANKEQMKGVCFIRFPSPRGNLDKWRRWTLACNRPDLTLPQFPEDVYICSKHFVGGNGPTMTNPDPEASASLVQEVTHSDHGTKREAEALPGEETLDSKKTQKKGTRTCQQNVDETLNFIPVTLSQETEIMNNNRFTCKSGAKSEPNIWENKEGLDIVLTLESNGGGGAGTGAVTGTDTIGRSNKKGYFRESVKSGLSHSHLTPNSLSNIVSFKDNSSDSVLSCGNSGRICAPVIDIDSDEDITQSVEHKEDAGSSGGSGSCSFEHEITASGVTVPMIMSSGAPCQVVLTKLSDSNVSNSNGLPILIKVLPAAAATNILPTTSVAVIPVKSKKRWLETTNRAEFCFKWATRGISVEFVDEKWIFTAVNGSLAEKQLILSSYGDCEVKVLGNSLPSEHTFFEGVPRELQEENDFHCLINQFMRWRVCAGNEVVEKVFEDTIIAVRAFVCGLTHTLRSKYCDLLVNGNGPIRCKECKMLLNRIRRLKYQKLKSTETEERHESSLNINVLHEQDSLGAETDRVSSSLNENVLDNKLDTSNGSQVLDSKEMSVHQAEEEEEEVSSSQLREDQEQETTPADFLCMNMIEYGAFTT